MIMGAMGSTMDENPAPKIKLLGVEGKDEVNFFKALLNYLDITGCEIRNLGGKNNFKNSIPALLKTSEFDFEAVEILAIIRDADNSSKDAFISVSNIVKKEGLKPPRTINSFSDGNLRVGIFVMPGNSDTGMLEDLCLETVKNMPVMGHVNHYINCVEEIEGKLKEVSKAKAQVYLASRPNLKCQVGLGALKNYWDFTSSALDNLKIFLEQMR